ncbi:hypothetical protein [Nonomuraea polychroma]|uniref:hypothetical protein n=1 Tax=Nonomuraea polychroma TaxID=46176 RepID=UPI0019D4641D|nr:hypothetical protein [Nonomuraea polychroma]
MDIRAVVFAERPDLHQQADHIFGADWPEFIFHHPVADQYLERVREFFKDLSLLLVDGDDRIVAGGWGVPVRWDGTIENLPGGYDDALRQVVKPHEKGRGADTQVIAAAQVRRDLRGRGLAGHVLGRLADFGAQAGLTRVIAPVRPTLKATLPVDADGVLHDLDPAGRCPAGPMAASSPQAGRPDVVPGRALHGHDGFRR